MFSRKSSEIFQFLRLIIEYFWKIKLLIKDQFSTFPAEKKALMASHFSQPKYRIFGHKGTPIICAQPKYRIFGPPIYGL